MTTPLDVAYRWYAEDFAPITVPWGTKSPDDRKGWQKERWTREQLPDHFNGGRQNVGVLNGIPSKNAVDADLDCAEMVAAAVLLPPTKRIGGRPSRPRSRRYYRTRTPLKTAQFIDPVLKARGQSDERAMIAELRSTGSQTVVYGRHPSGEDYLWHEDGPPALVDAADLNAHFRRAVVAAFLGRHWAGKGGRHAMALAASGLLLNCGVSPENTEAIIETAATIAGDDEVHDRVTAARTTAEKHAADEEHTGGTTLADLLGEHGGLVVRAIQKWLLPTVNFGARTERDGGTPAREADNRQDEHEGAGDDEPPATVPVEARTLPEVIATFQRWQHMPDPGALEALLGTIAANAMDGDPVWLMLVGPPGGGKTTLLQALRRLPNVHTASTVTEAGLLSGVSKKDRAKGSKGGLLRQLGDFGYLVFKDWTSTLSMNRDQRSAMLSALREVYDGLYTRDVGTDGHTTLRWEGKAVCLFGCTPIIDEHHAVIAAMGDRWLQYRMGEDGTEDAAAADALAQVGDEEAMRDELAAAVAGLFVGLEIPSTPPALSEEAKARIITLASLAARARSAVLRDPIKREIVDVPPPEAPTRLAKAFRLLYTGMMLIGVEEAEAWRVLTKMVLDAMPRVRGKAFLALADTDGWLSTTQVEQLTRIPVNATVKRALEDLMVHGVAQRRDQGAGKPYIWTLTPWAATRFAALAPFLTRSEKSDPMHGAPDEPQTEGERGERSHTTHTSSDFSDQPPGGEPDERQTSCWRCREALTSVMDAKCERCDWIVCPACGACEEACGAAVADEAPTPPPRGAPTALEVFNLAEAIGFPAKDLTPGTSVAGGAEAWAAWAEKASSGALTTMRMLLEAEIKKAGGEG